MASENGSYSALRPRNQMQTRMGGLMQEAAQKNSAMKQPAVTGSLIAKMNKGSHAREKNRSVQQA
jgi:hypothetical protein